MFHHVAKIHTLKACHCYSKTSETLSRKNTVIFVAEIAIVKVRYTLQSFKGSRLALTMHAVSHLEGKVPKLKTNFSIKDQQQEFISKKAF